jgi:hypothetical protein
MPSRNALIHRMQASLTVIIDSEIKPRILSSMTANDHSRTGTGPDSDASSDKGAKPRVLSPEAQRALAEAQARRAEIDRNAAARPKEINGRNGPEPTRYDDWEIRGIATDF